MFKKLVLSLLLLSVTFLSFAQSDKINLDDFDAALLENMLFDKINEYRTKSKFEAFTRNNNLDKAAKDQANAFIELNRIDAKDDVSKRIKKVGGTGKGVFNALAMPAAKGKETFTYEQLAKDILNKLVTQKAAVKNMSSSNLFYEGIACVLDAKTKKVYFSQVLAGLDVNKPDKAASKKLAFKYTNKLLGYEGYSDRACKQCEKFANFSKIYDGIEFKKNKVFLNYDNLKELKKLLKKDDDGIAVEIVQRKQYPCGSENIINAGLPTRGAVTKPYYSAKIFKKNFAEGGEKAKAYSGVVGKLKGKVLKKYNPENCEINVLVLQGKTVCKVLKRTYLDDGDQEPLIQFSVYPDTAIIMPGGWEPTSAKGQIKFKVPFEVNKFDYKGTDIKPIIDALNEPKYKINNILITAHSSLEGDSSNNRKLQERRAASITNAIEEISRVDSGLLKTAKITTTFGWEIFQQQIKESKGDLDYFKGKDYAAVIEEMRDPAIMQKLDPYLKQQRYAEVTMNVTYDVSGPNEYPFVIQQLNKAIADKDGAKALKIQRFAIRKILQGKYDWKDIANMNIPNNPNFATLKVNQVFLNNVKLNDGDINETVKVQFDSLAKKSGDNPFVMFNKNLVTVKYDEIKSVKQIDATQKSIESLYGSSISQKHIDAMNLAWQFKVMQYMDSVDNTSPIIPACLDRIKKIFNIESATWQNALKLGYIFIANKDYKYAMKVLEPFLEKEGVSKELYFTYLTAAAPDDKNVLTRSFRVAMTKAREADRTRFCNLFGAPKLSFQMLEHPLIKEEYCQYCNE